MSLDLHIHSSHSDGTLDPCEIVQLAIRKGLKGISITDHDSISSYEKVVSKHEPKEIKILAGVELSVTYEDVNVHLLGYGFDHNNSTLESALRKIQNGRLERNLRIIEKINDQGIPISEKERDIFISCPHYGRPHIAKLLVQKKVVRSVRAAFKEYLAPGGKAYISRPIFHLQKAVDVLHKAGGIAIVAHPFNIARKDVEMEQLLDSLKDTGIDGVEAYYPTHSKKMSRYLLDYCARKNLICSGGSDYHGDLRPGTYLAGGKNVFVPESVLQDILSRRALYVQDVVKD